MVEPGKLDRVRLVEDRGRKEGSTVSAEVLTTDPDTLFPLQGALGYDMAQHLFLAPFNLVVEGTSDYTYLTVVSDLLKENSRGHLDDRWSVVPVGGADLIPTFVALLGVQLAVTVLIDSRKEGHQKLSRLAKEGYLRDKCLVTVGEVLGRPAGDIEDLFVIDDYLLLYNTAFGKALDANDITGSDPVEPDNSPRGVGSFDHGKPADALLRNRNDLLPKLSEATLANFEKLFLRLNATLPAKPTSA